MADVVTFEISLLLELEGSPGLISIDDIALLETVLREAYNMVAGCDATGGFITVTNVSIHVDAVDSFGDDIDTGVDTTLSFAWLIVFEGQCRGCSPDTKSIFANEQPPAPECACTFPEMNAFIIQCNELILQTAPGFPVAVQFGTSLVSGGENNSSSSSYSSFVTISGTSGRAAGGFTSAQLNLLGQAFLETYNAVGFFNPAICDPNERIATSVVVVNPDSVSAPGKTRKLQDSLPFSLVFEIRGTCVECGDVTVVFGSHVPSPIDETATCPVGSTLRCPSEEEFQEALESAVDRLQEEIGESFIETIENVVQSDATPLPTMSPTFSCGGCSDDDLCTVDSCDRVTGECIFEPITCEQTKPVIPSQVCAKIFRQLCLVLLSLMSGITETMLPNGPNFAAGIREGHSACLYPTLRSSDGKWSSLFRACNQN